MKHLATHHFSTYIVFYYLNIVSLAWWWSQHSGGRFFEFEDNLIYRLSSRIARATQRNCIEIEGGGEKKKRGKEIEYSEETNFQLF